MKKLGKKIVVHDNTLTAFCTSCFCLPITCTCKSTSYDPTGSTFQGEATSQIKTPQAPYFI